MGNVLMDVATGRNFDDAVALAVACSSPEIALERVTVATPDGRAVANARAILNAYGRQDVALIPDHDDMVNHRPSSGLPQQEEAIRRSAAFMAEALMAGEGHTIVATGPLSNVAAILKEFPRAARHIKEVVFMGGWSSRALPEANLSIDPSAAALLVASDLPLCAVGYEATLECILRRPQILQLRAANTPGAHVLYALYLDWVRNTGRDVPILHDPLTVALLCDPSLVDIERVRVSMDLSSGPDAGILYRSYGSGREVAMCQSVDLSRYLEFVMARVLSRGAADGAQTPNLGQLAFRVKGAHRVAHHPGWRLSHVHASRHILLLVAVGACRLYKGDGVVGAGPGSILYLAPDAHCRLEAAERMEAFWFHFDVYANKHAPGHTAPVTRIPGLPDALEAGELTESLVAEAQGIVRHWMYPWPEGSLYCQAGLIAFIARLFSLNHEDQIREAGAPVAVLARAKRYIEERVTETLTLDAIGAAVGMSKYYLIRAFRDLYGLTPLQYQSYLRMERAKQLLLLDHPAVTEIANSLGYASIHSFSRAFRRHVGISPSEFRSQPRTARSARTPGGDHE